MLAAGGTCRVWLARDERLGDTVALKFLQPHLAQDPTLIAELRKEAAANRQLTHQNIVQLYDIYESPAEAPFLVMEFVEGASLHTLRQQKENEIYRWPELRPILLQLCSALDHAHGVQLIHRDLKPANILIDLTGRVKLADFGISASLADAYVELLGQRDTRGTVTFMSPQQMDGEPPAVADDLYALGSTLYELLTGEPPFHTGDLSHQVQAVPPNPSPRACAKNKSKATPPNPSRSSSSIASKKIRANAPPPSAPSPTPWIRSPPRNRSSLHLRPPPLAPPAAKPPPSPRRKFSAEFYIVMTLMAALLVIAAVTLWTVFEN